MQTNSNDQLFNKVVCYGDIHFGLKNNSQQHNQDCIDFINWFIKQAKDKDAETCIFLGDFTHQRNTVNVHTLNYMMKCLRLLNDNFKKVFMIIGNHDMFLKDSRSIHSLIVGSEFPNIELIEKPVVKGNVALVPFLVGEEWKNISSIKSKYMFGHLEIPGFKMNAQIDMPDYGEINKVHFDNQELVFSGHFHKRQQQGNISYIGNPFGHNYSDIWDFERGMMFLEWDKEPEFINYGNGPRYINITLSSLMSNPDEYLKPKTYLQVILDADINYEEASFLKETFLEQYNVREFKLIRTNINELSKEYDSETLLSTVDEIVASELANIESDSFNPATLIEIYDSL